MNDPIIVDARRQVFAGEMYFRQERSGYYYCGRGRPLGRAAALHREVWSASAGAIPPGHGHHVHHLNGDKSDNRLVNLQLVTAREHMGGHMTPERRAAARENMIRVVQPTAKAWHGTVEGRAWHRQHGQEVAALVAARPPLEFTCGRCGAAFTSQKPGSLWCSAACRAAQCRDRRAAGIPADPTRQTILASSARTFRCPDCGERVETKSARKIRCDDCQLQLEHARANAAYARRTGRGG